MGIGLFLEVVPELVPTAAANEIPRVGLGCRWSVCGVIDAFGAITDDKWPRDIVPDEDSSSSEAGGGEAGGVTNTWDDLDERTEVIS